MADVTTTFAAKDESFAQTVSRLQEALGGFGRNVQTFNEEFQNVGEAFSNVATKGASLVLGFVGVTSAFDAVKQSFNKAAEFQELTLRFETLLGNAEAAEERMDMLAEFMDKTPFELPGIVRANITLQNLTDGALATEQGMTGVGDAAAALGVPFDEMAQIIGRTYTALQAGQPIGELNRRMLELGMITPEVSRELAALSQEAGNGARAWTLVEQEMSKFSGAMQQQSTTWNSTMSGFGDAVDKAMRAFATPLLPALTTALQQVTDKVSNEMGPAIEKAMNSFTADWLPGILNAFTDIGSAGTAFNNLMITGAKELANTLINDLSFAFRSTASGFSEAMKEGNDVWMDLFEAAWYVVSDKVAEYFLVALKGAVDLVKDIIPGMEQVSQRLAQEIEAASSRIDSNMQVVVKSAGKVQAAFERGSQEAEFIDHRIFDSSENAQVVADYLIKAQQEGSAKTQSDYRVIADTHAPEIKRLMDEVSRAAENSEASFAQIKLDLSAASASANEIQTAFSGANNWSDQIALNLNNSAGSAQKAAGWFSEGKDSASKISMHGNEFQTSAAEAASKMETAKGDAKIVADVLSGPQGLTEKFNEAMSRTKDLRDVIDYFIKAGKEVGDNLAKAARLDQDARQYQRNEDRAHNLRERGYDKTANQVERNAKDKFLRDSIKEEARQNAEDAKARAYERAEDAKSLKESLDIKMKADREFRDTMDEINRTTKEGWRDLMKDVQAGGKDIGDSLRSGGKEASDALKDAAAAVKEALGKTQTGGGATEVTLLQCRNFLDSIDQKLPQNALSP